MANIINAGTNGVTVTGAASAVLNIQVGGTNALQIGTGATLTLSTPQVFPAGTAAAPSITTTGDVDTGMYFPAANQAAISAGGTVAAAFNSNGLFFRNRIINGDMRIDQRNAGAAVTTSQAFPVDRFRVPNNTDGAFSAQQDSSAPTGFTNSLKYTVTTADTNLTTTQNTNVTQVIEGTNVADLAWGTANARTVTLSFWVRSSLTGTFGGSLRNASGTRSYPFTYSISAANTWEYKTITISGDTSGTWSTGTNEGVNISFGLGAGPDASGTAGAWNSNNNTGATGQTQVIGTLNATWYITGVQFETGSVATPFERRPYGTELMLCQRYYYRMTNSAAFRVACGTFYTGTLFLATFNYPVTMRAAPTGSVSAAADFAAEGNSASYYASAFSFSNLSSQSCRLDLTVSGGTQGYGGNVFGEANKSIAFSAEL